MDAGINKNLNLGVGNISYDTFLGAYYQNISPAIIHINNGIFAKLDENGIPFIISNQKPHYAYVAIIQYGLMCYDLLLKNQEQEENKKRIINIINWLDKNKVEYNDSFVWKEIANNQYQLKDGWISGMYQGQAISLFLRAYQLFENEYYLKFAEKIFNSFKYDYLDGGFKRIDKNNNIWFEEYPTNPPSFVLNGFIYSILGILDYYRVTKKENAKYLWDECVKTLEINLSKYDVWYWSIYDQLKKQLVSYYYQKNVHIPLMQIMYQLTNKEIFNYYAIKWEKNLNNPIHNIVTKIMYRVQPRLKKLQK